MSQLISFEALKLAAGAVILSPFIPMLFMGEEYAEEAPFTYFVSHSDPELIQAVRQGRKQEFEAFHYDGEPPDPEAVDTFLICKLNWDKRKEGKHQVLWLFHQHLIRLRNTLPSLLHRDFQSIQTGSDEDKRIVWWRRWHENSQVLCLMNFSSTTVTFDPDLNSFAGQKILDSALEKWMGNGSSAPEALQPGQSVTLSAQSFVLYQS